MEARHTAEASEVIITMGCGDACPVSPGKCSVGGLTADLRATVRMPVQEAVIHWAGPTVIGREAP